MTTFNSNIVLRWTDGPEIASVAWCHGKLFVGAESGIVYSFGSDDIKSPVDYETRKQLRVSTKRITRLSSLEPRKELLALDSDGNLHIFSTLLDSKSTVLCKKVTCFCRQAVECSVGDKESSPPSLGSSKILPITYMANICVASRQKIQIFSAIGEKIVHQRDITTLDTPSSICWLNNAIVFGSPKAYSIVDQDGTTQNELCSNDPLMIENKGLNTEYSHSNILAATCLDNDVMVVCQNIGVFYNTETMNLSQKNSIQWSGKLEFLGSCPPFIIGLVSHGKVEIYGIRDQLLYKQIDQSNIKSICFMQDKCLFLASSSRAVSAIEPSSYYDNLCSLLERGKISEALQLVNLYFAPNDPRKRSEIKICHTIAGWIRFSELNFPCAFQHFSFGTVDVLYLMKFWDSYYPSEFFQSCKSNEVIPDILLKFIPRATNISEFVKQGLECKTVVRSTQGKNDGKSRNPYKIKNKKSQEEILEIANRSLSLFLLKRIKNMDLEQGSNFEHPKNLKNILVTVTLLLLAEYDDPRYNLILKNKLHSLVDVQHSRSHLIKMDKSNIYSKLLIRDGQFIEAMDILADLITRRPIDSSFANGDVSIYCMELSACINTVLESFGQPKSQDVGLASTFTSVHVKEMIFKYLPILLENSPSAALEVLTRNHSVLPITSNQILTMIDEHCYRTHPGMVKNELQIKYLEDLVITHKSGGVDENTLLAQYYIDSLSPTFPKDHNIDVVEHQKQMLFSLLEGNYTFDIPKLECIAEGIDLPEIKVILNAKLGRHYQAIETIFTCWDRNVSICEAYCLCFGDFFTFDQLNKDCPYKRLFTNFSYWVEKAKTWPSDHMDLYKIDSESQTSIDKLIMHLLNVVAAHTKTDQECTDVTKNIILKSIHLFEHKSTLNGLNILEFMPEDWNFSQFSDFFKHLQLKILHEQRTKSIKKGLVKTLQLQTSCSLYQSTSAPPIKIDGTTICSSCLEPIRIGMPIAMPVQQGKDADKGSKTIQVLHEYCAKKGP
ncbi:hypothetical protein BEWA_032860 [Theileria equi strain WA]|uniref:CNH domain-containing protein n=1 Tax=Theileria equi strain WA TaxID=1537102 RepID=L0AYX5_THEEQ|nr:hypothetical protein BEWA_032860 [Theileria equi strain WA]AFZ80433.1 hypothetical protein BEWA_032860 [Theileria equi strain WA]|eukprot:XP_004830099.1 hypothetical protein BEWA_032860 [Theileria equi strain WA]